MATASFRCAKCDSVDRAWWMHRRVWDAGKPLTNGNDSSPSLDLNLTLLGSQHRELQEVGSLATAAASNSKAVAKKLKPVEKHWKCKTKATDETQSTLFLQPSPLALASIQLQPIQSSSSACFGPPPLLSTSRRPRAPPSFRVVKQEKHGFSQGWSGSDCNPCNRYRLGRLLGVVSSRPALVSCLASVVPVFTLPVSAFGLVAPIRLEVGGCKEARKQG